MQATKRYFFSARLYTYRQPNINSLHLHGLSYGSLVRRCEPGFTHQQTKHVLKVSYRGFVSKVFVLYLEEVHLKTIQTKVSTNLVSRSSIDNPLEERYEGNFSKNSPNAP
jgi:hypothetical protein